MKIYLLLALSAVTYAQNAANNVNKCYVCIDECSDPPAQHDCQKVLTPIEEREVEAACFSYAIKEGDRVTISKGCIPVSQVLSETCSFVGLVYPQVTCKMCHTDLCNHDEEIVDDKESKEDDDPEDEDEDNDHGSATTSTTNSLLILLLAYTTVVH